MHEPDKTIGRLRRDRAGIRRQATDVPVNPAQDAVNFRFSRVAIKLLPHPEEWSADASRRDGATQCSCHPSRRRSPPPQDEGVWLRPRSVRYRSGDRKSAHGFYHAGLPPKARRTHEGLHHNRVDCGRPHAAGSVFGGADQAAHGRVSGRSARRRFPGHDGIQPGHASRSQATGSRADAMARARPLSEYGATS